MVRGRHCIIDGWALRPDGTVSTEAQARLHDPEHLAWVLEALVARVGMVVLRPPELVTVPLDPLLVDTDKDCGGTTGTVILTTSHASVHTWPLRGQVSFDLYSCRDFETDTVCAFLSAQLLLSGATIRSVPRYHDPADRFRFTLA